MTLQESHQVKNGTRYLAIVIVIHSTGTCKRHAAMFYVHIAHGQRCAIADSVICVAHGR